MRRRAAVSGIARRQRAVAVLMLGSVAALAVACGDRGLAGCGRGAGPPPVAVPAPPGTAPGAGPSRQATAVGTVGDPLLVWADATPDEGTAPLGAKLKASVSGGAGPYTYRWGFGDGSAASSEREPEHTFREPGTYRVELRVTAANGETDADEVHVVVR